MELPMYFYFRATTAGTGPFRPAIVNGKKQTRVFPATFDSEDKAYNVSRTIVNRLMILCANELEGWEIQPQ